MCRARLCHCLTELHHQDVVIPKLASRCHCGDGVQIVSKPRYYCGTNGLNSSVFYEASFGPSLFTRSLEQKGNKSRVPIPHEQEQNLLHCLTHRNARLQGNNRKQTYWSEMVFLVLKWTAALFFGNGCTTMTLRSVQFCWHNQRMIGMHHWLMWWLKHLHGMHLTDCFCHGDFRLSFQFMLGFLSNSLEILCFQHCAPVLFLISVLLLVDCGQIVLSSQSL